MEITEIRQRMAAAAKIAGRAPKDILLCAASKTQDAQTVRAAAALPIDLFGENRVQELTEKTAQQAYGAKPVHLIGHLQTNKVKQVVGKAAMIQSVDSLRLLQAIDKQAKALSLVQDILIEVNIGGEESKNGVQPVQLQALADAAGQCANVCLCGLMTIPPIAQESRVYFAKMHQYFTRLKDSGHKMEVLSMGMSDDYEQAILEGATMVRIGTALFGRR